MQYQKFNDTESGSKIRSIFKEYTVAARGNILCLK